MSEKELLNQESAEFEREKVTSEEDVEAGEKQRQKQNQNRKKKADETRIYGLPFFVWLKVLMVNVIVTVLIIAIYHFYFSPRIAIVDLTGYLITLRDLYSQGRISANEAKAKLDAAFDVVQKEGSKKIVLDAKVVFGKNPRVEVVKLPELPQPQPEIPFNFGSNSTPGQPGQ